jgi:LacI family transcriptional regulator
LKATRKSVAKAANVSVSTAGMILSGQGEHYNAHTRERVLKIAAEMGYQPSINARALRLKRSLLLGVIINGINTHLAAEFLQGMQDAVFDTDYSPLVFFAKSPADQDQCLNRCLDRRVDGLLINCTFGPTDANLGDLTQKLAESGIPVVEVFGHCLPGVPKVNVDNHLSGSLCARHLIEQGHRRIALLSHSRYENQVLHLDAWQQACGYRAALTAAALAPLVIPCDLDFNRIEESAFLNAGFNALETLMALPQPPTAVLCYNDLMAFGFNRACRLRNLKVPGDFSISGNGDNTLSAIVYPPLTTARLPHFKIGSTATVNLLKAIEGEAPADTLISPVLVKRQSIGPPARSVIDGGKKSGGRTTITDCE